MEGARRGSPTDLGGGEVSKGEPGPSLTPRFCGSPAVPPSQSKSPLHRRSTAAGGSVGSKAGGGKGPSGEGVAGA